MFSPCFNTIPRHWIGHWLMLVATILTLFGFLLCAVAVVWMPASGFWLAGPALWALLRRPAR